MKTLIIRAAAPLRLVIASVTIVIIMAVSYSFFGRAAAGSAAADARPGDASARTAPASIQAVSGMPDTLRLDATTAKSLRLETVEVRAVTKPQTLQLQGSLALNTNRLVRVHSRFAGEVISVAEIPDPAVRDEGKTVVRPVSFGDMVHKDQLLAVVWCKDLGEKKSELADAVSQLNFDQEQLAKMNAALREGAMPETRVRQQERNVEADLNAVARAERTLRVWRLPESEIQSVKDEAERIRKRSGQRDVEKEKNWARVEVCAPMDGVIVEKNVSVGDIIDTTADLFKVANVDTLTVWANAYEENLPGLLDLPAEKRVWSVRVNSDPSMAPLKGRIENIGYVSDPTQHTVMIMGEVANPGGRYRAGQFITATVDLRPPHGEVVAPAGALVEDGRESIVFVRPDAKELRFTLRRVAVAWRSQQEVYLRSELNLDEAARGLQALRAGERVVSVGAIELQSALEDQAEANKAAE